MVWTLAPVAVEAGVIAGLGVITGLGVIAGAGFAMVAAAGIGLRAGVATLRVVVFFAFAVLRAAFFGALFLRAAFFVARPLIEPLRAFLPAFFRGFVFARLFTCNLPRWS